MTISGEVDSFKEFTCNSYSIQCTGYQAFLFKTTINLDLRRWDEQCIKSVIHQLNILWKTENIYHSWKDVFFIWKNYSVESVFIIQEKESKLIYPTLPHYQVSEWYILWPLINMYILYILWMTRYALIHKMIRYRA